MYFSEILKHYKALALNCLKYLLFLNTKKDNFQTSSTDSNIEIISKPEQSLDKF